MTQFDRQTFKAVIHHVCASAPPADLGRIRLHKVLYLTDMLRYLDSGVPLTGEEYQKQEFGPAAKHLAWALDELVREGRVEILKRRPFGLPTHEFVSLLQPDPTLLGEEDRALIGEILGVVYSRSVSPLADLNLDAVLSSAKLGETLPYFTAYLLVPCEVTDADVAWGEREARELRTAA